MIRMLMVVLGLAVGMQAQAKQNNISDLIVDLTAKTVEQNLFDAETLGLNLKVGDEANYNLDMGILKGTMKTSVLSIDSEGAWIQQLVELGFAGKQDIRILMDPNTGEVKKVLVNGQEQQKPEPGNYELIENKEDTITVPAGTFVCLYIKAKDRSNNQELQQWVNLKEIPVLGMVKSIVPAQFGPVTIELTSFKRN